MTKPKAKRRPQTLVFACTTAGPPRELILHLLPHPYVELYVTEEELAADAAACLTDGLEGQFISSLRPRAICGERVQVVAEPHVVDRRCHGCFGTPGWAVRKPR